MRRIAALVLVVAAALLSGCPSTTVRPPSQTKEALPKEAVPSVDAPDVRGATLYSIESNASDMQIHVFRGGKLARLGHNHVMTSKHVTGRVWMHTSIERSGFEIVLPVGQLIVDDAQARATAGSDFPGEISADDREGTKKNMLRTEVLDAEHHPTISLRSVQIAGSQQSAQVIARITIKEVTRDVTVPTSIAITEGRLTATGEFDIVQTEFGIKPFSIGLGALEVLDRLHIEFKIVALKQ